MSLHVAFLRAINVGRARRIAMADLRDALAAAGRDDVRTLGQSGNLVLRSSTGGAALERELADLIEDAFGLEVPVMARSAQELAAVVAADPFGAAADDPRRYQAVFFDREPDPADVAAVLAADVAPERVAFSGREAYCWHPGGIRKSPLAALLARGLPGVAATARNWRTVTAVHELARQAGRSG